MPSLLAVQPDRRQADALRQALGTHVSEDVMVAESLNAALSSIDRHTPDVLLLPTLMPAAVEDYLITYLGAIPGARHVQILGLPRLERSGNFVQRQAHSLFAWRRPRDPLYVGTITCDPDVFAADVLAYLANAKALKQEIGQHDLYAITDGPDRRRERRFATHEVPWISVVRLGNERAALINVSARGALLRTGIRPEHHLLRRPDSRARQQPRLILELESELEVEAMGRVIRCVPSPAREGTQYEVAFTFDESVGLHLPAAGPLVAVS